MVKQKKHVEVCFYGDKLLIVAWGALSVIDVVL